MGCVCVYLCVRVFVCACVCVGVGVGVCLGGLWCLWVSVHEKEKEQKRDRDFAHKCNGSKNFAYCQAHIPQLLLQWMYYDITMTRIYGTGSQKIKANFSDLMGKLQSYFIIKMGRMLGYKLNFLYGTVRSFQIASV